MRVNKRLFAHFTGTSDTSVVFKYFVYAPHVAGFLICAFCGYFLAINPGVSAIYGVDDFGLWTFPYRTARGQVPGQDFVATLGFLYYGLAGMIVHASHFRIPVERAFYLNLYVINIFATAVALFFTRGEKSVLGRTLLIAAVASTVGVLHVDRDTPILLFFFRDKAWSLANIISYMRQCLEANFTPDAGMSVYGTYRPFAGGFFGLAFFRWAYCPSNRTKRDAIIDGILLGILLMFLCYSKITYFVGGSLFALTGWWFFRENRFLYRIAITTFVFLSAVAQIAYKGVVAGYVQDILLMMATESRALSWDNTWVLIASPVFFGFILCIASYFFVTLRLAQNTYERRVAGYLLLSPIAYLFILQYDGGGGLCGRVVAFAPLFITAFIAADHGFVRNKRRNPFVLATMILLAIPALHRIELHLGAIANSLHQPNYSFTAAAVRHLAKDDSALLVNAEEFRSYLKVCEKSGIEFAPCRDQAIKSGLNASTMLSLFRDSVDMIERNHADRMIVMDFTDPYSLLAGLTLPLHIPTWFSPEVISPHCFPSGEALFSNADYVLVPHYPEFPTVQWWLLDHYGDDIARLYNVADQDDMFTLYRRKHPPKYINRRYACDLRDK
jgi:hypothetical protein